MQNSKNNLSEHAIKTQEQTSYPMTDTQLSIYLACLQTPESLRYNIPIRYRFSKSVAVDAQSLCAGIKKAIELYPFLKTYVCTKDEIPVLVPNPQMAYAVESVDARNMSDEEIEKDFVKPFDLGQGPLFNFRVYENESEIQLLADVHHLICDGSALRLLLQQVINILEGKECLKEETTAFEICNNEVSASTSEEYAQSKKYFDDLLAGVEVDSNLVADEIMDASCKNIQYKLHKVSTKDAMNGNDIREKLKSFGIKESSYFLSAFAYTLAKMTGQSEALFCTVSAARRAPELKNTMGMLARTLPIYAKIDEEMSTWDYMKASQQQFHATLRNDAYPFMKIVEEHEVKPDVFFVYQGEVFCAEPLLGGFVTPEPFRFAPISNFALEVHKVDGDYSLWFEYSPQLYLDENIESFGEMMLCVLQEFLQDIPLKSVCLAKENPPSAYKSFNSKRIPIDASLTMLDLLRSQFAKHAKREAISFKDITLTFEEFDNLSERVAQTLLKHDIKKQSAVGILVQRSARFPICTTGILKAGCICLPLDASYPSDRLQYMLEDSGTACVIADRELHDILQDYKGTVLFTDDIKNWELDENCTLPEVQATDLFALLYTSGSTGKPKGVMLTHANLVSFCLSFQEYFQLDCEARSSVYGSFGFDASMQEMYPYLTCGASIHIIPQEIRLDLAALHEFLLENKISHTEFTTQVARQYAIQYPDNPYMRALTFGGEKFTSCPPPSYPFYNTYGPTEGTIYITSFPFKRECASVPIGKPVANTDIYIVDAYDRALPMGALGELCVAGPQVSLGYLHRPELTAEKFKQNPFSSEAGFEKMYLTGDVCRYLPCGNIQYVGRRDEQVKIRGFRIELGEIEYRISEFAGIKNSCVVAKDLPSGGKAVVAYIVGDEPVNIDALNAFIAETLPHYMVPAITMQIEKMPLNPNGKIDKRRLPTPTQSLNEESTAPRELNVLEKQIVEIITELTGLEQIDPAKDFVSLGLSSLSMMALSSRMYKHFDCRISVAELLDGTNLISLENKILQSLLQRGAMPTEAEEDVAGAQNWQSLKLSAAQLGVYYDSAKRPDALIYNIPMLLHCGTEINADKLAHALRQVIALHPIMSVHVETRSGVLMQVQGENKDPLVEEKTLSPSEFSAYKQDFVKPFKLDTGPLYRAAVVICEKEVFILIDVHHIIFDGVSMGVLLQELQQAYDGNLPKVEAMGFYSALQIQDKAIVGEKGKEAQSYYEDLFSHYTQASAIAADLGGKAEDGALGEYVAKTDIAPIQAFCKENKLTLAHVFLAATFYTVARFTAQNRVYISSVSNGRDDVRFADCIGMFVQTMPLSTELCPGQSVLEFCAQSRHLFQEAIAYGHFPHLSIQESFGYSPHINYACQLGLSEEVRIGNSLVHSEMLEAPLPKFDISIQIEEREQTPAICVQYNDALYSEALIKRIASAMAVVVQNMVANPQQDITKLSMLSKEEEALLSRFGKAETRKAEEYLMHRCLEKQVQKTPERTALIASDGRWTFEKMNTVANQMAHGLLKRGLQKQDSVLLLLPRSGIQVIAQYAVLKAGGVFIPCDPSYPKERILHIMEDSGASFIVSSAQTAADWQDVSVLSVEQLQQNSEQEAPSCELSKEDLAYMIYTSGSTGKPKGVMITHGGISNHMQNHKANAHLHALVQDASVVLSVTTVSFDLSIKDTSPTLCNGLTVVLADDESANHPQKLTALFKRYNCDAFSATASRMAQFLSYEPFVEALSKCKVLMSGGEAFPFSLMQFLQRKTNARIFNAYGPTEITISCNEKEITHEKEITVGSPLLGVNEYIVDSHGNILPTGVMGELYVGGAGVARGYRNRPELTESQFIMYANERVYKTGDYAKWTDAGDVVILGRCDRQLKLRGLRIEPGEIEQVLISYEGVTQAVVRVRDFGGTEHLCAWFCAMQQVDVEDLKAHLHKKLTAYMVPMAYAQLESLPITPNGKLDEKELETPQPQKKIVTHAEPKNELETVLCHIYADVLKLDEVGALDSFFDLGGSSLSVTNVLVMAQEKGITVSYGDIFAHPTPRALAAKMSGEQVEDNALVDVANYDYSKFEATLKANTLQAFSAGERYSIGNILLAGPTGFLGIHVLHSFLENETGTAYCVLRGKNGVSAQNRLKAQLFYYFDNNYEELFDKRIFVVQGDVTKPDWQEAVKDAPINTLINCAASVKHFAKDSEIEDVNVGSVEMMVAFCKPRGIRLVHVSTVSVGGDRINDVPALSHKLTEEKFYFGQDVSNQYVHSKFMAERVILEAMQDGLDAKIMRVGNLAAREADGEFQINFTTNAAAGRLRAYDAIGAFPFSAMEMQMEFSPIDSTAKALLLLAQTPAACSVFHPYNNHSVFLGDIILSMRQLNMDIELTEDNEFQKRLDMVKDDANKAKKLTTLLAYEQYGEYANAQPVEIDNAYTSQILYRMGFMWPNTSGSYLRQFLEALATLGFFDKDE